jgi:Chromatin modification-related protein EAF7
MSSDDNSDDSVPFLDTVEGEISFFRSLMRARPVGLHRHFHVLSMRNAIHGDTGQLVSIDDIWAKLRTCYNVDAIENLVCSYFIDRIRSERVSTNRKRRATSLLVPATQRHKRKDHHLPQRIFLRTLSFARSSLCRGMNRSNQ